jgi:hypothetical protein
MHNSTSGLLSQRITIYEDISKSFQTDINSNNNKHSLRSNTKGYGDKIHQTDSQNSNTTAPSGRELYHLQFLLQTASPKTSGYSLILSADWQYYSTLATCLAQLQSDRRRLKVGDRLVKELEALSKIMGEVHSLSKVSHTYSCYCVLEQFPSLANSEFFDLTFCLLMLVSPPFQQMLLVRWTVGYGFEPTL